MSDLRSRVESVLGQTALPDGGTLLSRDLVRALSLENGALKFIAEFPNAESARRFDEVKSALETSLGAIDGITSVSIGVTAHEAKAPPSLKAGRHPTPAPDQPGKPTGVDRIVAIASGKGGVGKSTLSANLAVALAKQGRRVGLLDADIYGPSQPRMMGVNKRPASPDGKTIIPLTAHGVTIMSIGLMLDPDKAVVWRGPMLMGALQQMLGQVAWGELDILLVDLPPGTGDVQLTLCQRTEMTGALVVSTPQDVALLDARRALDMFATLKTPVLGLVENMSAFHCPKCGEVSHIFGHGGVRAEAEKLGLPFLGEIPISLDLRLSGDAGTPAALGSGPEVQAFAALAKRLIDGGMA